MSREISEGRVILPIWHGVTKQQVLAFSPPLADKVALKTTEGTATDIAIQILRDVRPDLYAKHPRAQLEKLASGQAIKELQEQIEKAQQELEAAQAELKEYRCPYCDAPLSGRNDAPLDPEEKHWDVVETFACGYSTFGGEVQQPCPRDARFPKFEDYELRFKEDGEGAHRRWSCHALGKTEMARKVFLPMGLGSTKAEALRYVRDSYERYLR